MILKGSQRGGARHLAAHLLNDRDNDHVTVQELRGFIAGDLQGALDETRAIAKGTRCRQFVFSLSLNPPKDAEASLDTLIDAADRAEVALGLKDQPRAILVHEKHGRRHIHVVWSRIKADEMKAINLPHFKNRLRDLSKELYLEHGWELPDGHKTNGWKNPLNFTLAEWQQAKRLQLDPREIKQALREAWDRSDNLASFRNALEERGLFLAKGDRRGFVVLDVTGEALALARWCGLKTKDVNGRLGSPDGLPGVEKVRQDIRTRMARQLKSLSEKERERKRLELEPLAGEHARIVEAQRAERTLLQERQRARMAAENKTRAERFRRGLGVVLDLLTGRLFATRRQNETEAHQSLLRDAEQREALYFIQAKEREGLSDRINAVRKEHARDRTRAVRGIIALLRSGRFATRRERGAGLDMGR